MSNWTLGFLTACLMLENPEHISRMQSQTWSTLEGELCNPPQSLKFLSVSPRRQGQTNTTSNQEMLAAERLYCY